MAQEISELYEFPMYLGLIVMDISKAEYFVFCGIAHLEGFPDHLQPERVSELYEDFHVFTGKNGSLRKFRDLVLALNDKTLTDEYELVHSKLCQASHNRASHVHRMWMCYTPSKEHFETMYKGKREQVPLKEIKELAFEISGAANAMSIFVLSKIYPMRLWPSSGKFPLPP